MLRQLAFDFTGLTVPLIATFAFILPLLSKIARNRLFPAIYALIISVFIVVATTTIYVEVSSSGKPIVYAFGGWPPPIGIAYEIDGFNAILGFYAGWIILLITLFSIWYNNELDEPEWYYTLLLGFNAGLLGCFYTGDVFNLFVMLEVLSISIYGLVSYHKNNPVSLEAAFKYAIIGATATTIYFIGLIIIYGWYSSLNMAHILEINIEIYEKHLVKGETGWESVIMASTLAVSLALWVFTFKSGLFPNHFWIPDVYCEAPTPVSALLPSLSEIMGVYIVVRFLYTIFPAASPIGFMYRKLVLSILLILGFIGGVIGALMMFIQRDVKRILGYSSISHIGLMFMILSIGAFSNDDNVLRIAFTALLTHIIAHGLSKVLLFSSIEVFIKSSGSKIMDDMRGVGRKYPLVSLALIIGFLNLAGVIPLIGFFSKLLMYQAYMSIGQVLPALGIIIISALSIPGYAKPIYSIVFSTPVSEFRYLNIKWFKYYLLILTISLFILGVVFISIYSILDNIVYDSLTTHGLMKYLHAFEETVYKLRGGL
ncbi:MAG: proton-conducting transporter membrane subunit [Desulfurococcaceae archaeon]